MSAPKVLKGGRTSLRDKLKKINKRVGLRVGEEFLQKLLKIKTIPDRTDEITKFINNSFVNYLWACLKKRKKF